MSEPALNLQELDVVYRVRGVDRPVLRGLICNGETGIGQLGRLPVGVAEFCGT